MARTWLILISVLALALSACTGPGESPAPVSPGGDLSPAPSTPDTASPDTGMSPDPGTSPDASPDTGASPDPGTSPDASPGESPTGECVVEPVAEPNETVSGDLLLLGWSAAQVEDDILRCVLDQFMAAHPNVTVTFEQIAQDYPAVALTRLGGEGRPDLFYVNQAYATDWVDQGVLMPLDQLASDNGFDLAPFYESYLTPFQVDGQTYAIPKDSSVLGMQTNDQLLADAGVEIPTTIEELEAAANTLMGAGETVAPMCFASEWQRAGAFVHAYGGGLVDESGAPILDSSESRAGLEWYLRMHQEGLATRPADIPAGWCGEAFGRGDVAIAFEGNWIGPAMDTTYPDVAYTVSPIPAGPGGQRTLSFTAGYGIHPNTANPEASWALLEYLTSQEGMQRWVEGGLVLPARTDVEPTSELQEQYVSFAEFATAGEGVTPQWTRVADAFNSALASEAGGGYTADNIINATLPVLQEVTQAQ